MQKLIGEAWREVVWWEQRDAGEMFPAEVGVWQDILGFTAYVLAWGGGLRSKPHPDQETAKADTGRLWEKFYGS
jgi:hypothetical protein